MNRCIHAPALSKISAALAVLALAIAGCSSAGKAEVTVEQYFSDAGLLQALVEQYTEETGDEVVITTVSEEEMQKLISDGQFGQCLITSGADIPAVIEKNGLAGGEFCFDSLMLIAPLEDRAGISQLKDVSGADVLKHIALTENNFVHAPADSPLGKIEKKLWQEAGIMPEGDWYISASSDGLGILDEAQARNAYALVDRRSVALVASEYVSLKVVYANLKGMSSSYYAFTAPAGEGKDNNATQAFTQWLQSDTAKGIISGYDVMGDEPAFLPGKAAEYKPVLPTPAPEPSLPQTTEPATPESPASNPPNTDTASPQTSTPSSGTPQTPSPEA